MQFFKKSNNFAQNFTRIQTESSNIFFFLLVQFYIWGVTGSTPNRLASRTWLVQHKVSDFNHSAMISQGSHHKKLFCGIHFGQNLRTMYGMKVK